MDKRAIIDSVTHETAPWLTPELRLKLITDRSPWWTENPESLLAQGIPEPFWGFAWAGGQALARYILDNPDTVRDKNVVDFGAGGGIVSLAALRSGARSIVATEIDPWAKAAFAINVPTVRIFEEDWIGRLLERNTVLLCGDMSYSAELCDQLVRWFEGLDGVRILLGDANRGFLPARKFRELKRYKTPADYDSAGKYFVQASVVEFISEKDFRRNVDNESL